MRCDVIRSDDTVGLCNLRSTRARTSCRVRLFIYLWRCFVTTHWSIMTPPKTGGKGLVALMSLTLIGQKERILFL